MIDCLRDDDNKKKFILSELKKIEPTIIKLREREQDLINSLKV